MTFIDRSGRTSTEYRQLFWDERERCEELEEELKRMKGINKESGDHAAELQAQLEAVREYLQHREACTIYDPMVKGEVCTCGLEAAIGEDES